MQHKIQSVTATPVNIPLTIAVGACAADANLSGVVVEVTTDSGLHGHGFTAITEEEIVAAAVNAVAAPNLLGADALAREHIAERLYWLLTPRGQTGYAAHAISAIDLALWDILGHATGLPCWKLLGGARDRVPLYVTFGFGGFSREQLGEAARHLQAQGVSKFKMVVGHHALARRNEGNDIQAQLTEDVARVRAVREALGDGPEIYVDANCSLSPYAARWLADRIAECDIAFFEEPVRDNDPAAMADLRRATGMRVAAGQNEGQLFRFEALMNAGAVDVIQPNAVICGGFTIASKVAALAQAKNVTMANGGAFPWHNMHLNAGLANGGLVEWHLAAVAMGEALYTDLATPTGWDLPLPDTPGLGFALDRDKLRDLAALPLSAGRGKA
ncbi:mandelate racemase/muconate lactonizing enzyme family protein [Aestuariivita sp.]|jgi:L-alanine-DL-glutamate epimerase-like enolase superfamily enzyme|uniref:mandelate racemase/muconate lactonizing enzyme family protein n=1 Tax=Aestuariivita sp. TaxID=1872407 RepID=UPI00216B9639|nr:mandelate racemase/muconate lactonizing enzyme family protein [Aestuariivita sp.]MCE8005625.1 mandelate racemase/muconate lactonizing enzyme family protein [Aestuariivita sp.]